VEAGDGAAAPRQLAVAAVVPSRDSPFVERVVAAIRSGSSVPAEIVVVDDGSRRPVGMLAGARTVRTDGIGRGGARNVGAQATTAPYLWFVDADVLVRRDTLSLLFDALLHGSDAAMAVYSDRPLSGYEGFRLAHQRYQIRRDPEPRHVSGACLLLRRSCLEAVGGFGDLPALEDVAFGIAGWRKGYRWRSVLSAHVDHLPRGSALKVLARDHRERGIVARQVVARYGAVLDHAASPRELAAFASSVACLGGALVATRPWGARVSAAALALWSWADWPWLRHAWGAKGPRFTLASVGWLLLFRMAVASGVLRAYAGAAR
jgi:Glycosyl transferase family 2